MNTDTTKREYSTPQVVVLGSLTTFTQGATTYGTISADWQDVDTPK